MLHRFVFAGLLSATLAACTASATVHATGPAPVMVSPAPAPAAPAAHPAYLHALTDLRAARGYLERVPNSPAKWDGNRAIGEIDAAIGEIKRAAIDDGKPVEDHPPVDVQLVWGDRMQRALELVNKARQDISREEDNAFANGLRDRAVHHIDAAASFVQVGIEEAGRPARPVVVEVAPAQHPAYLHALTDLRAARAWLERPARADVKFDENRAIREIDAAIGEIKTASIDDGKPLTEHPPVDVAVGHRDRLRKAMELLHGAAEDIDKREDDQYAHGLRRRANEHIRRAEKDIRDAIEDRRGR